MKVRYFLRGLGVGIIFSAVVLLAAYKTNPPQMTDQQIKSRAKELGLIEGNKQDDSIEKLFSDTTSETAQDTQEQSVKENEDSAVDTKKNHSENNAKDAKEMTAEDASKKKEIEQTETSADGKQIGAEQKQANSEENDFLDNENNTEAGDSITITIYRGMSSEAVSEQLEKNNIIDDATQFNEYLCKKGYASRLITGKYQFSKEETYNSIVKKITR